ncbi:MAG: helicase C-terminal domain-containing protein [Planctomycetaceae bacterium]
MPPKVSELAKSLLFEPIRVEVTPDSSTVELIKQVAYLVPQNKKRDLLFHYLEESNFASAIIFTRTKRGADMLAERLHKQKIKAEAIHGNKSQNARQRILNSFKIGKTHILVATDLAARGIDVDGISHVINYDMPQEAEDYVHRIGRTGRAGADGIAVTFFEPREKRGLQMIERLTGVKIEIVESPKFADKPAAKKEKKESPKPTETSEEKPRRQGKRKPKMELVPSSDGEKEFKHKRPRKDFRKKKSATAKSSFGKPGGKKPFKYKAKPKRRPGK